MSDNKNNGNAPKSNSGSNNSSNSNKGKGMVDSVKNGLSSVKNNPSRNIVLIIGIILLVLILIFITIYIVYIIKKNDTKSVNLTNDNYKNLNDRNKVPYVVPSDKLTSSSAGQEYSFNFWIYLSENYDSTTQHKIIIQKGPVDNDSKNRSIMIEPSTSPIIVMDKNNNEMHFAIATSRTKTPMSLEKVFEKDITGKFVSPFLISSIQYVPLQKWVNITLVIIDNIMRIYVNDKIYSVTTTNDLNENIKGTKSSTPTIKTNNDDLYIGNPNYPTKGHIAKLLYYNYAISQDEIRSLYKQGPTKKSWLSYIGLSEYGVQSPIYKIDDDDK